MFPDSDFSLENLQYYGIPNDLLGKKTTVSELEQIFGGEIELLKDKDFLIFGFKAKNEFDDMYLAHECNWCNELTIGPPREDHFNTLGEAPLSGAKGFSYYCRACDEWLYTRNEVVP